MAWRFVLIFLNVIFYVQPIYRNLAGVWPMCVKAPYTQLYVAQTRLSLVTLIQDILLMGTQACTHEKARNITPPATLRAGRLIDIETTELRSTQIIKQHNIKSFEVTLTTINRKTADIHMYVYKIR